MSRRSPFGLIAAVLVVLVVAAWFGRGALWSWLLALHGRHGRH